MTDFLVVCGGGDDQIQVVVEANDKQQAMDMAEAATALPPMSVAYDSAEARLMGMEILYA